MYFVSLIFLYLIPDIKKDVFNNVLKYDDIVLISSYDLHIENNFVSFETNYVLINRVWIHEAFFNWLDSLVNNLFDIWHRHNKSFLSLICFDVEAKRHFSIFVSLKRNRRNATLTQPARSLGRKIWKKHRFLCLGHVPETKMRHRPLDFSFLEPIVYWDHERIREKKKTEKQFG